MTTAPQPPVWPARPPATVIDVGRPGGFWIRFVAFLIDGLILSVAGIVIVGFFVVFAVLEVDGDDASDTSPALAAGVGLMILSLLLVGWLYEALMTSSAGGATLGKMAVGLRIVRADGAPLSFGRATGRHFLKTLITPLVPLFIGYLLAAFTQRKQALHDFLAETLVIKVR